MGAEIKYGQSKLKNIGFFRKNNDPFVRRDIDFE